MTTPLTQHSSLHELLHQLALSRQYPELRLTDAEFDHIFKLCDALWLHSGDPKEPHAELTSGKCSNGFVDVLRVLRHTRICQRLARELFFMIFDHWAPETGRGNRPCDWVVGSDHAGATISYEVARQLGVLHDFTEKGPDKTQIWKRFTIDPDQVTLQIEELVTTTGTLQAVRDGLRQGNAGPIKFFPAVLTLVHRSNTYKFDGAPIRYLRHYDIQTWSPEECPLCAQGSKRLRPKQNWAELTGKL